LCRNEELPQLGHELGCAGLQKSRELNLHLLGIRIPSLLEHTHCILEHHLVLEAQQLGDAPCDPGLHHRKLHLVHVDLGVKVAGELELAQQRRFFVREPAVLRGRDALVR
jgi:hypothetical protein